jgi:tetratricopeptide (TPR) repeat protein
MRMYEAPGVGELEKQLEQYPDDRFEILLELAEEHSRQGRAERAEQIYRGLIAEGGEDAAQARAWLTGLLFDVGRGDDAREQLEVLRTDREADPETLYLAGEALETGGDLEAAHRWYTMALSRFTTDPPTELPELSRLSGSGQLALGRRRVREALGLPADDVDRAIPEPDELFDRLERHAASVDGPREMQVVMFLPEEYDKANLRWAAARKDVPPVAEHLRASELRWREASADGTRIVLVPITVDGLAGYAELTGGDPEEEQTRTWYGRSLVLEGQGVPWPPARNAPCWCGSAAKYKKCHGRPDL